MAKRPPRIPVWIFIDHPRDCIYVYDVTKLPRHVLKNGPISFEKHKKHVSLFVPEELLGPDPQIQMMEEDHKIEQFYSYKRDSDEDGRYESRYYQAVGNRLFQLERQINDIEERITQAALIMTIDSVSQIWPTKFLPVRIFQGLGYE